MFLSQVLDCLTACEV